MFRASKLHNGQSKHSMLESKDTKLNRFMIKHGYAGPKYVMKGCTQQQPAFSAATSWRISTAPPTSWGSRLRRQWQQASCVSDASVFASLVFKSCGCLSN